MINLGFVLSSVIKDRDVIDNFKYRRWYTECIDELIKFPSYEDGCWDSKLGELIYSEDNKVIPFNLALFIVKDLEEQINKIKTLLSNE